MEKHYYPSHNSGKKIALGLILITAGVLLMMRKLGYLDFSMISWLFSWPMLLVVIGFVNLFGRDSYFSGLILIVVGGFFLIPRILGLDNGFLWMFWPLLLIIGGILIIFKHSIFRAKSDGASHHHHYHRQAYNSYSSKGDSTETSTVNEGFIDTFNLFGGSNRKVKMISGGKLVNIFGGSEIDLMNAKVEGDVVCIEVINVFGGGTLFVPSDWEVKIEVVSIFGGFNDKRGYINSTLVEPQKKLIIKGVCVFGGGEIKSKY